MNTLLHIEWQDPHWYVWVLVAMTAVGLIGTYGLLVMQFTRDLWGERITLNVFSPKTRAQSISLWAQWAVFLMSLTAAFCGPNLSTNPETAEAGAVEFQNVFVVSNSMASETDTRPFYGALTGKTDPGKAYQWGTRLDTAKAFFIQDLLPQLKNNKAGIVTAEGAGYNMWDITSDLGENGAFMHMLPYVQPGAASGAGCNITSGLQTALAEFDLIDELEKKAGDTAEKVHFIALWTDGGFTGDENELNKVLDEMVKRKVRLLIVDVAGNIPVTVPKYDLNSHKRNGEYFKAANPTCGVAGTDGLTKSLPQLLQRMEARMKGLGKLILAPPGTKHITYSIPEKAGGLYARPTHSNLKPILLLIAMTAFFSLTTGGGGLPKLRYLVPKQLGSLASAALRSIKSRLGSRTQ